MAKAESTNKTTNQHEQVFKGKSTNIGKTEANLHDIDMSKDQASPGNNGEREAYHGKLIHPMLETNTNDVNEDGRRCLGHARMEQTMLLEEQDGTDVERIANFFERSPHTREVFAHEFTNWAENLVVVDYDEDDEEEEQQNDLLCT